MNSFLLAVILVASGLLIYCVVGMWSIGKSWEMKPPSSKVTVIVAAVLGVLFAVAMEASK